MKAIVLGFGKSGKSVAELLLINGYEVYVIDKNEKAFESSDLKNNKLFCSTYINLDIDFDLLVFSSGIKKDHEICVIAKQKNIPIISEAELAFRYLKNKCIAITGTNGKTTTVKLIEFILNDNEVKAKAIGNIGKSLCSYVIDLYKKDYKEEIAVIELSSFQLDSFCKKAFDIAVILNITEDHINWHGSFDNYVKAKLNIQNCLKKNGLFFISKQIKEKYYNYLTCKSTVLNKDENINAAYLVCKEFGIDKEAFMNSYKKFISPNHRIEFVSKIKGISFFNDSKSTNVASSIYAVNNLEGNIILIAGGDEKNLDFSAWKKEFTNKVKYIFLIGKCAKRIKEQLNIFDAEIVFSLEDAIKKAYKIAKEKDKILFSPGSSSFDQFKNFEQRGETFKSLVKCLERMEEIK